MNRLTRVIVLLALLLLSVSSILAQNTANIRFVHVIPNAAPVDIYVNGTLAIVDLDYTESSPYFSVPTGNHTITVTPVGLETPLWEQDFTAESERSSTFIASSVGQFDSFDDNLTPTAFGSTRLLLVHAVEDAPAVDVALAEAIDLNGVTQEAGTIIAPSMSYGTSFGAFDLPAQSYAFDISLAGSDALLIDNLRLGLASGTSYMAIVYGEATNPQALLLSRATSSNAETGLVRFVNAIPTSDPVDIFVNDTLFVPSLTLENSSEHLALPFGEHTVSARANDGSEITQQTISIDGESDFAHTLALVEDADDAAFLRRYFDNPAVNNNIARIRTLNTIADATALISLDDTGESAEALEGITGVEGFIATPPTTSSLTFELSVDGETGVINSDAYTFYGGVYYSVLTIDGSGFNPPFLLVLPTSVSMTLGSAPGADSRTIATTSSNTTTPDSDTASQDSEVVTAPEPQQQSEVVQSTPVPQQQPQVQPPANDTGRDVTTARVVLDPSANLQLRQYPDSNALSLGLAPSGTIFEVIGREGAPVALVEGQDPPPEAESFVDPATELPNDDADLDPGQTWLRVSYETPDSGRITAWVLSQYLVVRDPDGDLQRLADLPTVGRNIPGEAEGTEITPPPIPEDVVTAEVFNLNPGVRLNMRRNPSVDSEVLERLPSDTVVELIGFAPANTPSESDWAFVRYRPAEGGTITGWVSTLYVRYQWNGRDVDSDELFLRELISFTPIDTVGRVSGGAEQAAVPTPDPLEDAFVAEVTLNPGANLQFRVDPDRDSESLNLIPSGTRLIITGRTEDAEWLRTTFEGEAGWVSSQFVTVSFNGEFVELFDIPVVFN